MQGKGSVTEVSIRNSWYSLFPARKAAVHSSPAKPHMPRQRSVTGDSWAGTELLEFPELFASLVTPEEKENVLSTLLQSQGTVQIAFIPVLTRTTI